MHLEAITSERKKIFQGLKKFPKFYLVGGTALALQIGHRISLDFDLFSKEDIPAVSLRKKVKRIFNEFKVETIVSHSEQLSVKIDETRIDFVKYNFPLILDLIEFKGITMTKIPEIAAMKAHALSYRATRKDYVDLYFILKDKHSTLKEVRKIAERKYKNEFYIRLFLEQLVYLKDFREEKEPIEFLKKEPSIEQMQKFFEKEVKKLKI